MSFEPIRILQALNRHGVEFVVIGGIAAAAHGSPTVTQDLDICYERSKANLQRLADALTELGAKLRGVDEEVPFLLDAETFERGDHFTFTTKAGGLDILGTPLGTNGYPDLIEDSVEFELDGLEARMASLEGLMRMKRAAGRPKDRIELEILGALRDELDSLGSRDD